MMPKAWRIKRAMDRAHCLAGQFYDRGNKRLGNKTLDTHHMLKGWLDGINSGVTEA